MTDPYLSVQQTAEALNVSERTLYRWLREGCPVAFRRGAVVRLNLTSVLQWLQASEEKGDAA